jgi:transmembrane sensor
VVTRGAVATALGTSYLVRTGSAGTRVTVVDSSVRLCARTGSACVNLAAGQTALVSGGQISTPRSIDTVAALAWTRGWLEADDMPAAEALEELAQHLPMALRFDPAELQGLRVTGSYPLDRPLDALEAMAGTARMAIEQGPDGELKVSRRK